MIIIVIVKPPPTQAKPLAPTPAKASIVIKPSAPASYSSSADTDDLDALMASLNSTSSRFVI